MGVVGEGDDVLEEVSWVLGEIFCVGVGLVLVDKGVVVVVVGVDEGVFDGGEEVEEEDEGFEWGC